ncbi:phosphate transport system substrate-binding protein [Desulfohalotomaculum tongense]|uniref:phosphate ABC transporter substrate-binding protein n=1 Tax=Desulforadius tongensis TaxID=1216062 RepID=UPI001956A760|nr:phosphate ABC transporter substrate-binding protein [Desulforadius tongensis]MBM7855612.1 phosphate transport system substrate-binding protein [Desulforadius tongensis]
MFKRNLSVVSVLVLVLAVSLVLVGCGGEKVGNTQKEGGSNELTGTITIAGSTSVQPLSEELKDAFMEKHPGVIIHVQGGGSSAGIKAAITGAAEIGAASRNLKESEQDQGLVEHKIAVDGIAVVVNAKNTAVESLTVEQVRKIMCGEITNWSEVGGPDAGINVVSREEGSGTRSAFTHLVMKYKENGQEKEAELTAGAAIQSSNGAVRTTVANDEYAIGYLSLGYLDDSVRPVKIDGVEPTAENILQGRYKIARPFLYLTKGEPKGIIKEYIDWVFTPEAQDIVAENYVRVDK